MQLLGAILILLGGLGCAVFYLRKPANLSDPIMRALLSHRPWRRLGAAICLVLAIMFVLGVYSADMPDRPRVFAAYWMIMLVLVMWIVYLAIKDIVHTRRIIATWRDARRPRTSKDFSPHTR